MSCSSAARVPWACCASLQAVAGVLDEGIVVADELSEQFIAAVDVAQQLVAQVVCHFDGLDGLAPLLG